MQLCYSEAVCPFRSIFHICRLGKECLVCGSFLPLLRLLFLSKPPCSPCMSYGKFHLPGEGSVLAVSSSCCSLALWGSVSYDPGVFILVLGGFIVCIHWSSLCLVLGALQIFRALYVFCLVFCPADYLL